MGILQSLSKGCSSWAAGLAAPLLLQQCQQQQNKAGLGQADFNCKNHFQTV